MAAVALLGGDSSFGLQNPPARRRQRQRAPAAARIRQASQLGADHVVVKGIRRIPDKIPLCGSH